MQKNKTYKMVGLFVLTGFLVFSAIIFHYVGKKFTSDDSQYVVLYFEESIQGLNVGSSVVFKGVEVGQVAKISLITNLQNGTFKMPVFITFKQNRSFQMKDGQDASPEEILHRAELAQPDRKRSARPLNQRQLSNWTADD